MITYIYIIYIDTVHMCMSVWRFPQTGLLPVLIQLCPVASRVFPVPQEAEPEAPEPEAVVKAEPEDAQRKVSHSVYLFRI